MRDEANEERIRALAAGLRAEAHAYVLLAEIIEQQRGSAADRIRRLLARADAVWENDAHADAWARAAHPTLDGHTPVLLAIESEEGLKRALRVLERLENSLVI